MKPETGGLDEGAGSVLVLDLLGFQKVSTAPSLGSE